VRSRTTLLADRVDQEKNVELIRRYCEALEHARQAYDGVTIRYEELTADPAGVTQRVCAHLGVKWEPAMLDYGSHDHGRFKSGLGDYKDKIKTGQIQEAEPPPEEIPEPLRPIAVKWGYLPQPAAVETPGRS
jgi:hypothetical protein